MNVYKKIENDFSFLTLYGYKFESIFRHYTYPSVLFKNDKKSIRIGLDNEERKMHIFYYKNPDSSQNIDLLEHVDFEFDGYEKQVEKAKEVLLNFLNIQL